MDFQTWNASVKAAGGVPTVWPFSSGIYAEYYGLPAAKFTAAQYMELFGGELIPGDVPQQMDRSNQYAYVLAPESASVGAPHTMTTWEEAQNATYTALDVGASAVGLPSLGSIAKFLKISGGVALGLAFVGLLVYSSVSRPRVR